MLTQSDLAGIIASAKLGDPGGRMTRELHELEAQWNAAVSIGLCVSRLTEIVDRLDVAVAKLTMIETNTRQQ